MGLMAFDHIEFFYGFDNLMAKFYELVKLFEGLEL
jgi:hypothetical protein